MTSPEQIEQPGPNSPPDRHPTLEADAADCPTDRVYLGQDEDTDEDQYPGQCVEEPVG